MYNGQKCAFNTMFCTAKHWTGKHGDCKSNHPPRQNSHGFLEAHVEFISHLHEHTNNSHILVTEAINYNTKVVIKHIVLKLKLPASHVL